MSDHEIENAATPAQKEALVLYPWQQANWDALASQFVQQRLPHAILLQGVAYSGLESFASLFAQYLLCSAPKDTHACGKCRECLMLAAGTYGAYQYVTFEPNDKGVLSKVIRIDQIREVIDVVSQTSMHGGRKVIVITPAEGMNANAANALLKNLEEPPANTYFILVCHNPAKLMATIRSRCQVQELSLPNAAAADAWLASEITNIAQRQSLLRLSGNNPVEVKSWTKQGLSRDVLALGDELRAVRSGNTSVVQVSAKWGKEKIAQRLNWWWRWLAVELSEQARKAQVSSQAATLLAFMQKLLVARNQIESSANPNEQLLLESLLIDWQRLPVDII